ncbi:MAG TPA: alpha-galactosidase, partial [Jatrophihabitans sp.]|nr:alpha-galactosidase [Jatrophihabitans sp.]
MADDALLIGDQAATGTCLVLLPVADQLPRLAWVGPTTAGIGAADVAKAAGTGETAPSSTHAAGARAIPLLPAVSDNWQGRPGLTGHRLAEPEHAGQDWAPAFGTSSITRQSDGLVVESVAAAAGLSLRTEIAAVSGGPLRIRHTVTNTASMPYVVDALDVVIPLPGQVTELQDFTGRWGHERAPQRRPITDGVWLRESRGGRPGHASATEMLAGTAGFGFATGQVWAAHVAWSGNSRHFLERQPSGRITLGGGELLLPGEIVLAAGERYATPWVYFVASDAGMDGVAAQLHSFQRSQPAHPALPRPVVSNVWEAVYFDHDLARLTKLAELAARVGVERVVLDDGWFGGRRNDRAGLGDWVVSEDAWPHGLTPFVEHVQRLGMQFGLWFEPEMVNPDSDLYRAHPDWILGVTGREPRLLRNQLVLDLGRPEV